MNHDTIRAAHGRWREILPALGISTNLLNGKHQPCPMCGGKDRFRFTDVNGEGDYFCSQCRPGKGIRLLQQLNGWDFKTAAHEVDQVIGNLPASAYATTRMFDTTRAAKPASLRAMYLDSKEITDSDPVAIYLTGRGIPGPPWPKALRFIDRLRHYPSKTYGHRGMLAVFSDADGKAATIQRMYLTLTGEKAEVTPVRMFVPGNVPSGGAIRLGPIAESMGIAEGIETALSASALFGLPVWATTSDQLLMNWQPPQEVRRITVFGDNDINFAGQTAAYTLAKRLKFEAVRDKIERDVVVKIPPVNGHDWNDFLREQISEARRFDADVIYLQEKANA